MAAIQELWTESYRPTTVDEYVFEDEKQKKLIETWIGEKTIPHCIFSGRAGIGKTTLSKILIRALDVDPYDVLYVNASRENGIDFIREKIHPFCQTMPFGDMKVVLLDEADRVSKQGQDALKATMEEYANCVRFILTTNHPNRILPPLHSRCHRIHFEKLHKDEFLARAATVLVKENIEFDGDTLIAFIDSTYPDLRKCLNSLQQNSKTGKLIVPTQADTTTEDFKIAVAELFKKGKVREARKLFCESANLDDLDDTFRWMYENLDLWADTPEQEDEAILVIRRGLVNNSLVADQEVNLAATFIELANLGK